MNIEFPDFTPHLLCRNSHMQTVMSIYLSTKYRPSEGESKRIETNDGDQIVIHENTPDDWRPGNRIAVLVHGLCGSHRSQYMMRVSSKLVAKGFKTIRIDMRGFGDSQLVSRGHMHAGRSDDVKSVLDDSTSRYPGSPITIVGFSLGANIVLKLLCEYGKEMPSEIDSAVAVAPPVDLLKCTLNLRNGLNRFYDRYFSSLLAKAVKLRRKSGIPLDDVPLQAFPKKLFEFDDQYTAPCSGFSGAEDYYEKCSTHLLLDQLAIPTLLLVADNDPIVPFDMYEHVNSRHITMLVAKGGHLGFIAKKSGDPDRRWMDWRVVEWVCEAERCRIQAQSVSG